MYLAGEDDNELDVLTKIRIIKEKSSESHIQIARTFYADINIRMGLDYKADAEFYQMKQGKFCF